MERVEMEMLIYRDLRFGEESSIALLYSRAWERCKAMR